MESRVQLLSARRKALLYHQCSQTFTCTTVLTFGPTGGDAGKPVEKSSSFDMPTIMSPGFSMKMTPERFLRTSENGWNISACPCIPTRRALSNLGDMLPNDAPNVDKVSPRRLRFSALRISAVGAKSADSPSSGRRVETACG